jgi:hypothetical protein
MGLADMKSARKSVNASPITTPCTNTRIARPLRVIAIGAAIT